MEAQTLTSGVKLALFAVAGILCVAFALFLRLDRLDERPLHADEATGARILAERLESGSYTFDPAHFHGPLLTALAAPIATLRGERDWRSLSPETIRLGTALAGGLMVLLALGLFPWIGWGALFAAALIATSPFLVYYSRVFIHEPLFGFLALGTVLALFLYLNRPAWWTAALLGLAAGLLMATRETFVICFFAWAAAGALVGIERFRRGGLGLENPVLRRLPRDALTAGLLAFVAVAAFYTNFGREPAGLLHFFLTFFVYETGEGHDKAFWHYSWMLLWPKFQGGVWWTEAGVALAAIAGFALSFRHEKGAWVRFLFYAAAVQWVVYSMIDYKTPWLVMVAWIHLCLVAGAGAWQLVRQRAIAIKAAAAILFLALLWWQNAQADRAAHRYASDARNPYAYAPTSRDVERLGAFLIELAGIFPEIEAGPVAVIGRHYWPLPWYLRDLPATGYWPVLPEEGERFPVLLVLPAALDATRERVGDTHTSLPRGLRADTPIVLFIREDIWTAFLDLDDD